MGESRKMRARRFLIFILVFAGISLFTGLMGCGSSKPAEPAGPPSRYNLTGKIVSIDQTGQRVMVDAGEIPGFMSAMTMEYAVKNPNLLGPLSPGDQITADVVVNGSDIWLENIAVVKQPDQAKAPAPSVAHPSAPPPAKQQ